jgi:hypothetical protein
VLKYCDVAEVKNREIKNTFCWLEYHLNLGACPSAPVLLRTARWSVWRVVRQKAPAPHQTIGVSPFRRFAPSPLAQTTHRYFHVIR